VYPALRWDDGEKQLKVLSIGDSFFFHAFTNHSAPVYQSAHFFFYFDELHIQGQERPVPRGEVDLLKEMDMQDVIQLYVSDANLARLGWGFIEAAWDVYFDPARREPKLQQIQSQIRADANWMKLLHVKSGEQQLPLDTILRRDAIWVWENTRRLE
jgi:hypothetical protein